MKRPESRKELQEVLQAIFKDRNAMSAADYEQLTNEFEKFIRMLVDGDQYYQVRNRHHGLLGIISFLYGARHITEVQRQRLEQLVETIDQ